MLLSCLWHSGFCWLVSWTSVTAYATTKHRLVQLPCKLGFIRLRSSEAVEIDFRFSLDENMLTCLVAFRMLLDVVLIVLCRQQWSSISCTRTQSQNQLIESLTASSVSRCQKSPQDVLFVHLGFYCHKRNCYTFMCYILGKQWFDASCLHCCVEHIITVLSSV